MTPEARAIVSILESRGRDFVLALFRWTDAKGVVHHVEERTLALIVQGMHVTELELAQVRAILKERVTP